jgi:hypothetical protein
VTRTSSCTPSFFMTHFSKLHFSCSSLAEIMTEPSGKLTDNQIEEFEKLDSKERLSPSQLEKYSRYLVMRETKPPELSETCTKFLHELYIRKKYGERFRHGAPITYAMKGISVEWKAIRMLAKIDGAPYVKNKVLMKNGYLSGRPDVITEDSIIDIKASWDVKSFLMNMTDKISKRHWWQLQGYLALTGLQYGVVAFCLVTTPGMLVESQKNLLYEAMGEPDRDNRRFKEACRRMEKAMRFDDMPENERVLRYKVERDDHAIGKILPRIEKCREYLAKIETKHKKLIGSDKYINLH